LCHACQGEVDDSGGAAVTCGRGWEVAVARMALTL
jgi:hypothetical protein